jgi:hypothetical protein
LFYCLASGVALTRLGKIRRGLHFDVHEEDKEMAKDIEQGEPRDKSRVERYVRLLASKLMYNYAVLLNQYFASLVWSDPCNPLSLS